MEILHFSLLELQNADYGKTTHYNFKAFCNIHIVLSFDICYSVEKCGVENDKIRDL